MAEQEKESPPNPFTRPTFLLSACFLAVVIVLGVITAMTTGSTPPPQPDVPDQAAASSTPVPSQPAGPSSAAGCRPTDTSQRIPDQPPADVAWTLFHTAAVPASPSAGPLVVEGDVARCYARTPLGALLAVAQVPTRLVLSDQWQAVLSRQVMAGPGRKVMAASLSQLRKAASGQVSSAGQLGQIVGFKFVTYSPHSAVIQLVGRIPAGVMAVVTMTAVWDGDWKLQLQPDGQSGPPAQRVASLDGYVPWGGV